MILRLFPYSSLENILKGGEWSLFFNRFLLSCLEILKFHELPGILMLFSPITVIGKLYFM